MGLLPGLLLLLLASLAGGSAAAAEVASVAVAGTGFRITLVDGSVLAGQELVGAVLEATDEAGHPLTIRIDCVEPDPVDPTGETLLHAFSTPDGSGGWRDLCEPGPDGLRMGFPVAGQWTEDGRHLPVPESFSITCTAGAIGKCVRFGYRYWQTSPDGRSLWEHHQACVRLVRADYCGDGRSHTRTGTAIDLYDGLGIQRDEPAPGMRFEAAWGPDGAVCVARPRLPDPLPPSGLDGLCPGRLATRIGAVCTEESARTLPGVLLFTKS